LILLKDFIAIRKPPVQVLNLLKSKNISKTIIEEYKNEIKKFFIKYQNSRSLGEDLSVIKFFADFEKVKAFEQFYTQIISRKNLQYIFKDIKIIKNLLEEKYLIEIRDYLLILTEPNFEIIFPQYLVNKIIEQLNKKYIPKELAIKCLEILKKEYIKNHPNEVADFFEIDNNFN